jgi:hypothetical protein
MALRLGIRDACPRKDIGHEFTFSIGRRFSEVPLAPNSFVLSVIPGSKILGERPP